MNIHERRAIKSYDKKVNEFDNSYEGQFTLPFNRKLAEIVQIPEGGRLLDIAFGSGRLLKMLRQTRTFDGYGTDISEGMVQAARRNIPDMTFCAAPCDKLPFDDSFFNVVTVCTAFHHFPDVKAFAREVHRVLAPGGRVYIAEVYLPSFLRVLVNPFVRLDPSGDVKLYSPKEIEKLLTGNGFTTEPTMVEGKIQVVTAIKCRSESA